MRRSPILHAVLAVSVAALGAPLAHAQRPVEVAPNAPVDRPVGMTLRCQLATLRRAVAPLSATARASFPDVRRRFEAGLPPGHTLFVTTRLVDADAREEQVFVAVDSIRGVGDSTRIAGRIWSQIMLVRGFALRQPYTFDAAALVDWMIARPDGTEEGNVVGKFLDTYRPPAVCTDTTGT